MKLRKLSVKNFRGFKEFSIDFDGRLTVLVGNNASGKTSLLKAASIALGTLFWSFEEATGPSISNDDAYRDCFLLNGVIDVQKQYPIEVKAEADLHGEAIQWLRSVNTAEGRMTRTDAKEIINCSKLILSRIKDGDTSLILPIVAYYGTGRLWQNNRSNIGEIKSYSRLSGYAESLDSGIDEARLLKWFKKMSIQDVQRLQSIEGADPNWQFAAVKNALAKCFESISGGNLVRVLYNFDTDDLDVEYRDSSGGVRRQGFRQMSDGYRTTLNMIADIAYRMAVLNPLPDFDVLSTPGVVLIDEVDLHLHPLWQARILRDLRDVFPEVQFIVTTHAPLVVTSVSSKHLRVLDGADEARRVGDEVYGGDIGRVLLGVMGAEERPEEVRNLLRRFAEQLDLEQYDDAESTLNELESLVGSEDSEVVASRTALSLERMEW